MKTRLILATFLVLGVNFVFAQTPYAFKVLVSKGKIELKSGETVKVGATLMPTDEVKVFENSYLGLIHANGKPMEVRQPGNYKVSALVQQVGSGPSVLNKYTDFILSSEKEKGNRLSATGAVHRGAKDVITIYLPGSERAGLYENRIGLQWSSDVAGPYEVILSNLIEEELGRFETNEPQLIVDMTSGKLKNEYEVLVKVVAKADKGKGSKDYIIKKLRPADRDKISKAIEEAKASVAEESAINRFYMAQVYEQNLLINDALTAYQDAIKLAPDVTMFQDAYKEFLQRLGFEIK